MALNISVLTTVIFLLPMFYLLLAAPAFLLVRLDIPQVARLLRAMFLGYFAVLVAFGLAAAALNAVDGRPVAAALVAVITGVAVVWRGWMMRHLDAGLVEVQAAARGGAGRLRRLHWIGMAANALQTAAMVALIPTLVVVA